MFNDLSILADMYLRENDYETALLFLETEIESYKLFMEEDGNYVNRAYAGKAYAISKIYSQIGDTENAAKWYEEAKKHAEIYKKNPTMLISSMKYCHDLDGRMIDSYGEILEKLC